MISATKSPRGFEQAREAWLTWRADSRISHADRGLIQQVALGFNRQHYEKTGELIAWPGWEKIAAEAHLSKASIFRGFRRFERIGILEIRRGGRDPKTGWKLPNSYLAMPPGFAVIPGQVSPCFKSRFRRETRLSEDRLTEEESKNFKNGNPRGPSAQESKPSDSSKPSRRSTACDVPREAFERPRTAEEQAIADKQVAEWRQMLRGSVQKIPWDTQRRNDGGHYKRIRADLEARRVRREMEGALVNGGGKTMAVSS